MYRYREYYSMIFTHAHTRMHTHTHTHTHPYSLSMPFQKEDFVMVQSTPATPSRMKRPQSSAFLGGRLSLPPFMSASSSSNLTHSQTGQNSSLVRMVSLCAFVVTLLFSHSYGLSPCASYRNTLYVFLTYKHLHACTRGI